MSEIQILLIHSDKKEGLMVFEDITKRFAILSVIPFVGMFLSIALFPLLASWIKKNRYSSSYESEDLELEGTLSSIGYT